MMMPAALRRFTVTTHVTSSVGWVGAVLVFMALASIGLTSGDDRVVRGAYLVMAPAAWLVLVPLAHASLLSGIVLSLGTAWGLFRHYWVALKLAITAFATVILLVYMGTFREMAGVAADPVVELISCATSPHWFMRFWPWFSSWWRRYWPSTSPSARRPTVGANSGSSARGYLPVPEPLRLLALAGAISSPRSGRSCFWGCSSAIIWRAARCTTRDGGGDVRTRYAMHDRLDEASSAARRPKVPPLRPTVVPAWPSSPRSRRSANG